MKFVAVEAMQNRRVVVVTNLKPGTPLPSRVPHHQLTNDVNAMQQPIPAGPRFGRAALADGIYLLMRSQDERCTILWHGESSPEHFLLCHVLVRRVCHGDDEPPCCGLH